MNIEKAIFIFNGILENKGVINKLKYIKIDHVNAAITALKEKRDRDKGCEYCNGISKYCGFGYATFFNQIAADEIIETSVDVKFCPNCGKKLEVEDVRT